jgi:hypothetical protein
MQYALLIGLLQAEPDCIPERDCNDIGAGGVAKCCEVGIRLCLGQNSFSTSIVASKVMGRASARTYTVASSFDS